MHKFFQEEIEELEHENRLHRQQVQRENLNFLYNYDLFSYFVRRHEFSVVVQFCSWSRIGGSYLFV